MSLPGQLTESVPMCTPTYLPSIWRRNTSITCALSQSISPHTGIIPYSSFYHLRLVLPVLKLCADGTTLYVFFCVWFLSLTIMLGESPMLLHIAVHCFLLLCHIPLQEHSNSAYPFFCCWTCGDCFLCGLLRIKLPEKFSSLCLGGHLELILLDLNLGAELLGHRVSV